MPNGDTAVAEGKPKAEVKKPKEQKPAPKPVQLSSGKMTTGPTVTITCKEKGCNEKRVIKKQDQFQVDYCIPHQKEHRNRLRRERRKKTGGSKAKSKTTAKS